jgi:hypothetical protein
MFCADVDTTAPTVRKAIAKTVVKRMFVKRFFIFFPPDSENLEFLYCIFAGLPNVDSERFKFFIHNVFPLSALEVILFLKVLRLVARICLCFHVEIQSSQIGFRAALVFRAGGKRPLERTNPLLSRDVFLLLEKILLDACLFFAGT